MKMVQKRALKDAVNDPLAKKTPTPTEREQKNPNTKKYLFAILAAVIGGFIGGLFSGQFIRFRL
jgi:hypothetical protein